MKGLESQGLTSHLFSKACLLGAKRLRRGSRKSKRKQLEVLASRGSHRALQNPSWVSVWSAPIPCLFSLTIGSPCQILRPRTGAPEARDTSAARLHESTRTGQDGGWLEACLFLISSPCPSGSGQSFSSGCMEPTQGFMRRMPKGLQGTHRVE